MIEELGLYEQAEEGLLPKPLVQLQDVVCSIGETSAADGLVFSPIAISSPNPRVHYNPHSRKN